MSNKTMRVMIADQNEDRRLGVELLLGEAGYHRVVPVKTVPEMLQLIDAAPFGMLIINKDFLKGCDKFLISLIQGELLIESVLFYGGLVSSETHAVNIFFTSQPSRQDITAVVKSLHHKAV